MLSWIIKYWELKMNWNWLWKWGDLFSNFTKLLFLYSISMPKCSFSAFSNLNKKSNSHFFVSFKIILRESQITRRRRHLTIKYFDSNTFILISIWYYLLNYFESTTGILSSTVQILKKYTLYIFETT